MSNSAAASALAVRAMYRDMIFPRVCSSGWTRRAPSGPSLRSGQALVPSAECRVPSAEPASPLDRRRDEVPPLRPRAVVVPHVAVPEELPEHEPAVRRALADAAVGNDP